jgi:hypothetical protein
LAPLEPSDEHVAFIVVADVVLCSMARSLVPPMVHHVIMDSVFISTLDLFFLHPPMN